MTTENTEKKRPLNQLQYASKDFPTYFDALLARISEKYSGDYNDFATSSLAVMLVNIISYAMSQLAWYLDRQAGDTYLSTAKTLAAATRLAEQIGYKPKRAASASVDLTLTFAATAVDAIIPKGFRFQGPGDLEYTSTSEVLVVAGSTTATVNVAEGSVVVLNLTSTGEANQVVNLTGVDNDEFVADTSARAFVNGLEWSESDFLTFDKTNQFFVSYTSTPPFVQFGDGNAGNIPPSGAALRIEYRVINGSEGNVRAETITTALDVFRVGGDAVSVTVTNPLAAAGGSGPESLESIKRNAPNVFQTRKSAITTLDYEALVNSFSDPTFGAVSKGYASVARETATDATAMAGINAFLDEIVTLRVTSDTGLSDTRTSLQSLATSADAVSTELGSIGDSLSDVDSLLTTTLSLSQVVENAALGADGNIQQALTEIASAKTLIDSGDDAGAKSALSRAEASLNAARTSVATASGTEGSIRDNLRDVKTDTDAARTTLVVSNTTLGGSVQALVSGYGATATTGDATLTSVELAINTLDTNQRAAKTALVTYLDSVLGADCKANLVKVPILVLGADGFYAGPSTGLVRAVQRYLDGVKDVTHHVDVISGASALVKADIDIKVEYVSRFVELETRSAIESQIDNLLKARDFSVSLFLSDLYDTLDQIDGIKRVNIDIAGPQDHLDSDGNLIVSTLEIVSKGTVTIEGV